MFTIMLNVSSAAKPPPPTMQIATMIFIIAGMKREDRGATGGSDISVRSASVHLSLNSALTSVSAESQALLGFG
jgi:hypothetical protein